MADNENRATFNYTAEGQREVEEFRQKYALDADSQHLEALQAIDRRVTLQATKLAILIGVAGTLVLGTGLAMVLSFNLMLPGIVIGCVGIAVMASMPAFYERLLRQERRKAAPKIKAILNEARTEE